MIQLRNLPSSVVASAERIISMAWWFSLRISLAADLRNADHTYRIAQDVGKPSVKRAAGWYDFSSVLLSELQVRLATVVQLS